MAPTPPSRVSPIYDLQQLLLQCSDEAPTGTTAEIQFLGDEQLQNTLRTDLSTATSALENHEYEANTVLAASVIEALTYWALERRGEAATRTAWPERPDSPLDRWTLNPTIRAAWKLGVISDETRKACELAQDFRNLIDPGRQARRAARCNLGTAHAALAAIQFVANDLAMVR
jgi:hypothetical protein